MMNIYLYHTVQSFQDKLKKTGEALKSIGSLETILRVATKGIKFYIEVRKAQKKVILFGCSKLQLQLQDSIDILGFVQTFHYIQDICCRDKTGHYFFQRLSWQKCGSRIFLLFYVILADLKLVAKYRCVQFEKLDRVAFWGLSPLQLTMKCSFISYRFFAACEGKRARVWWKVVISLAKIVMNILGTIITVQKMTSIPCLIVFSGINLGLESFEAAKKIGVL